MTGERWVPSPGVRAYQEARMIVPALIAGASALAQKVHVGSKYTSDTHVTRFLAAQAKGDTTTARALADQAFSHGYRENIPDQATWQGIWQAMRASASPELGTYMDGLALTAGGAVVTTKGPNANSQGGVLDSLASIFQGITGPTADAAAVKAGQATASSLKGTVVLVGAGVVAIVIVFLLTRRRV